MKKTLFILVFLVVILFIVGFILKNILLLPIFYSNNNEFEGEVNRQIKSLLLNSIKNCHSTLFSLDKSNSYAEKFWFIVIKDDFMQSLGKQEDKYLVKLDLKFPDDWSYYFTVEVHDGEYIILNIEIDP